MDARRSPRRPPDFDHIDRAAQSFFEVDDQLGQVKNRSAWIEGDEEIDVAVRTRITTRDGPEYPNITGSVAAANCHDLVTLLAKLMQGEGLATRRASPASPPPLNALKRPASDEKSSSHPAGLELASANQLMNTRSRDAERVGSFLRGNPVIELYRHTTEF